MRRSLLIAFLLFCGCVDDTDCPVGSGGCACTADGGCDPGFNCWGGECVCEPASLWPGWCDDHCRALGYVGGECRDDSGCNCL